MGESLSLSLAHTWPPPPPPLYTEGGLSPPRPPPAAAADAPRSNERCLLQFSNYSSLESSSFAVKNRESSSQIELIIPSPSLGKGGEMR